LVTWFFHRSDMSDAYEKLFTYTATLRPSTPTLTTIFMEWVYPHQVWHNNLILTDRPSMPFIMAMWEAITFLWELP
jgi:hypothetical protein